MTLHGKLLMTMAATMLAVLPTLGADYLDLDFTTEHTFEDRGVWDIASDGSTVYVAASEDTTNPTDNGCIWYPSGTYYFPDGAGNDDYWAGHKGIACYDGVLYGTSMGASKGAVFTITLSSWSYSLIHKFEEGTDGLTWAGYRYGRMPIGKPAVDSSGNIYVETSRGGLVWDGFIYGPDNKGVVCTVDTGTANDATLHDFNNYPPTQYDGELPNGAPIIIGSVLYGTTRYGGESGGGGPGCLYKVNLNGTGYTILDNIGLADTSSDHRTMFYDGTYLYFSGGDDGVYQYQLDGTPGESYVNFVSLCLHDGWIYGGVGNYIYRIRTDGTYSQSLWDDGIATKVAPVIADDRLYFIQDDDTDSILCSIALPIPGDNDKDGDVDTVDYVIWADNFNETGENPADANYDGVVDTVDYAIWADNYGKTVWD